MKIVFEKLEKFAREFLRRIKGSFVKKKGARYKDNYRKRVWYKKSNLIRHDVKIVKMCKIEISIRFCSSCIEMSLSD